MALAPRQTANDEMRVRVKVYGLLIAAVEDPDRLIELSLPNRTKVAGANQVHLYHHSAADDAFPRDRE
jgi:hypothetical protein